jgi:type VI secretion system protein VasG
MAEISRVALFGKLNRLCYQAVESSTVFCKLRGNPYVELGHFIHQLVGLPDSDFSRIIKHFELDTAELARELTTALDRLPRGALSITDFSSQLEEIIERGWVYGTLMFSEGSIRSGHLMVGILKTPGLRNALYGIARQFEKIKLETLSDQFSTLLKSSPEAQMQATDGFRLADGAVPGEASAALSPAAMGKQEALKLYTVDLTEQARLGKLDAIVGRDVEIRQVIDILMRRRQNNPILTGDAGVGKTAVVEGFAHRIVAGDVPPALKNVSLHSLDVGLLQAGASMKGEFENRLRQVIEEVQTSERSIILFIDEAHTLVGAGGAAGTGDAANLLKPALARGALRTIGATTWTEYKKYIEKDPALARRFQLVQVLEPSEEKAITMLRGLIPTIEQHHQVKVLDEALGAAVRLSHRYIPIRQLPDKAVSLLDTACARVAISQHAIPPAIDDACKRIQALETELKMIEGETRLGVETGDRKTTVQEKLSSEKTSLAELNTRWNAEKGFVEKILTLRTHLQGVDFAQQSDQLLELKRLQEELAQCQGESPLILPTVDYQAVASVVQDWTGIPVGRMVKNDIENILRLAETLGKRIIGQDHALEMIARRVQTSRAGLNQENKPIGVFLLAGPSGVGKTETALALAEALYGGEQNVITINMSEYQEAHTVSSLKGAPPGYIGYGEGGVLTEAVRRRPYSVILLDEIEKAHPDVHEIFFQIFDKGWMEDGEGQIIDFKNTLILLTSNVGAELLVRLKDNPAAPTDLEQMTRALRAPLLRVFPPALLGRMVIIPYYPLDDARLSAIVQLQLKRIENRIQNRYKIPFTYDPSVVSLIVKRCTEVESGGRMIDAILTNSILPHIGTEFLQRMMQDECIQRIHLGVENAKFSYAFH